MYQNDPLKVLTGEVRLSYVHLVTPYANPSQPNAKPKYSATLLIPKTDTATKADIEAAMQAAIAEAVNKKWRGVRPPVVKLPLWDGDGVRQNGMPFGDECKGHWVMTASSENNKPQVVGMDNINTELAPQDIYSGMYARVTIRFFGYDNSGNRGIGCGLGNVMKTRDGEPLSGGASAASDFAGVGQSVMPNAAPTAPVYGAAPNAAPAYPGYAVPQAAYPAAPAAPTSPAVGVQINPLTGLPM